MQGQEVHHQPDFGVHLKDSSANYCILSYLPWQEVLKLQIVNHKFYNTYVPTVLCITPTETHSMGTIPVHRRKRKHFFVEFCKMELRSLTVEKQENGDYHTVLKKEDVAMIDHKNNCLLNYGFWSPRNPCVVHCSPNQNLLYIIGGLED